MTVHRQGSGSTVGRRASAWLLLALVAGSAACAPRRPPTTAQPIAARPPNIVLVFTDDQGYGDVGVFGGTGFATPTLDRMAAEGVRFTDFYVAQAVCSASRAALLTGSYSNRVGILGALNHTATAGLAQEEITIAEVLKTRGYATALVGKWHLGHTPEWLPPTQGFDEFYGLPYSNDMIPEQPNRPNFFPALPLIEGLRTIQTAPDQRRLTADYTARAVRFIESNRTRPFFLYLAHTMPHVPLAVSEGRAGRAALGLYGDVLEEIDWSVGQVLATIARLGLDDNTLVVFTTDNGPWLDYGNHGGSAGPLRHGKQSAFEGGVRVPFIARFPGRIPAGRVDRTPMMTVDLLPTFARLAGAAPPADRVIDGRDIWPQLSGAPGASAPHDALYFYWGAALHAVRAGRWKLHVPHPYREIVPGRDGRPGESTNRELALSLFDLETDVGETTDLAAARPDVVSSLMVYVERARADLGDSLTKRDGTGKRR